ncbi:hypothetical protein ACT3S7_09570 [Corynebacterium sp. AOP34-AQ2-28]|uniref:hypothetical protein n=2 Tax=Corynebacterium TaxID=1716 RepID=UPI003F911F66
MADDEATAAAELRVEMQRIAVPPPEPAPAGHRTLPVEIATWMIEDDGYPLPSLGDTESFLLVFAEVTDGDHGGVDVVTLDAWAEEVRSPTWRVEQGGTWRWWTILRGDGWTAQWAAPRPVVGYVRVTGSLHHDPYRIGLPNISPTRGRVCRIQLAGDDLEVDVGAVRLPFPSGRAKGRYVGVRSVRFTLDLDEATSPEPWKATPTWFEGFAVSLGGSANQSEKSGKSGKSGMSATLWRVDESLPLVWKTDLHSGESETVTLPVKISEFKQYTRVILGPQGNGCVVALKGHRRLLLEGGDDGSGISVSEVPVPPVLMDDMDQVVDAPEAWGGWIVGRYEEADLQASRTEDRTWHGPEQRGALHLGHVSDEGYLSWLNKDDANGPTTCARILATDEVVMIWKNNELQYLDSGLQAVGESRLPDDVSSEYMEVDTAGPWVTVRSVVIGGAGRGSGSSGLRISLVDPGTLDVVFSEPCGPRAQVQADGRDTVWLADGDLQRATRAADNDWTTRTLWREQESTE